MSKVTVPRFQIQQIALVVCESADAFKLLSDLGLTDWVHDTVVAKGSVFGTPGANVAELHFNYQAGSGVEYVDGDGQKQIDAKPLELEILDYTDGPNWMAENTSDLNSVSHLGMHVTAEQLAQYRAYFEAEGIPVAQEVVTQSHTNDYIKDSRRYNYVIFDTREIIGVDLKFIVRLNVDGTPQ
jgi:hypothetical protein